MGVKRGKERQLSDAYCFDGFHAGKAGKVKGRFGKPKVRILALTRRQKKQAAENAVVFRAVGMTARPSLLGICRVVIPTYFWRLKVGVWTAASVAR